MSPAEALAEKGVAQLNDRHFDDAVASFLAVLHLDPRHEQAWLGAGLALALGGKLVDFVGLADHRQRVIGDGFLFFHAAVGTLMTYRLYDHVQALARSLPPAGPYGSSAAYHAGCAYLLQGDEDTAFHYFAAFKLAIAGQDLPIGPESHFNVAYRQGSLIEDRDYVAALSTFEDVRARLPVPVFETPARAQSDTVLATACDHRYFSRFAPGFARSAAEHLGPATLHFHVIEPAAETYALLAELAATSPGLVLNLSTEAAGPYKSGAYYASSRFLIGPALLGRYGKRLVLTDTDVEFVAPLDDLLAATAPYDFAGFRHDGAGPCSRYPAVFTAWAPTASGVSLLDRVGRFVLSKLEIKWPFNWMLDQAALGSVLRWARCCHPEIGLAIINELTGRHFEPWLRSVGGAEKAQMIRDASR
jgi:tetratricopeptide (TPR) repeat protein